MPLAGKGRGRSRGVCYGRGRSSCEPSIRGKAPVATLNLRGDGMSTSDDSTVPPDVVPSTEPQEQGVEVDSNIPTNVEEGLVPPTRKRGRGAAKNLEFDKIRKFGPIALTIKDGETSPCCENYTIFTSRLTWLVKHHVDLSHPSWHDLPYNEKEELIARVRADFVLDWTKKNHRDTVTKTLRKRFNHIRYELHKIYKSYKTNEEALANVPELVTPATWVKLCARWSSAEFRMIFEKNKSNRVKQQTNHTAGRTSFVRLMQMRSESDEHLIDFFKEVRWSKKKGKFVTLATEEKHNEMVAKYSKLEPEKQTKDVAASIFREVLGHRPGYARGLGEMVIPESSRQNTAEKFAALTERAERHEKDAKYYKNQLEELRGNVEKVLAKQAEYDKLLSSYMESQRQTQGESHRETQGPA
ncbi:hypothetical protein I3842_Q055100 [Carya illinoinensis]|uniref:Transposase, Ptta/En/Spm, plant n=1 Tax=Carya illinoinensis TaxID=32201 RepID=A0A922A5B2_CARIL|nr:hypothetical protein I3842_Q055100 [Carya illinoinensis]